jgi:hypothetical protein
VNDGDFPPIELKKIKPDEFTNKLTIVKGEKQDNSLA